MILPIIRDIRLIGFTVAERNSSGDFYTVIAWCPVCHGWHGHTGLKKDPEVGGRLQLHRYPHCWCDAYTKQNLYDGYVIDIFGRATPEVLEDYQRNKPRGLKRSFGIGENPIAGEAA